jgi:hypothetical protein
MCYLFIISLALYFPIQSMSATLTASPCKNHNRF